MPRGKGGAPVSNRTRRKVAWDTERMRAYIVRDGFTYWAPQETRMRTGDNVEVLNPTARSVTVKWGAVRETWSLTPPSPAGGA